jgi:hypothetical protein
MAVLATEFLSNPDPLPHCNPASELHIAVTPFRMGTKRQARLLKQYLDALLGNLFCCRITGSFLHKLV